MESRNIILLLSDDVFIMKTTSIPLTELYFKKIEEVMKKENIPTKSELVRLAIRELIEKDKKFLEDHFI